MISRPRWLGGERPREREAENPSAETKAPPPLPPTGARLFFRFGSEIRGILIAGRPAPEAALYLGSLTNQVVEPDEYVTYMTRRRLQPKGDPLRDSDKLVEHADPEERSVVSISAAAVLDHISRRARETKRLGYKFDLGNLQAYILGMRAGNPQIARETSGYDGQALKEMMVTFPTADGVSWYELPVDDDLQQAPEAQFSTGQAKDEPIVGP